MRGGTTVRFLALCVVVLICAAGALSALFDLRSELGLSRLRAMIGELPHGELRAIEQTQALALGASIAESFAAVPQTHIEFARLLKRAGDQATSSEEKIDFYCKTLSMLGRALKQRPFDSQYLINWANMRQLLAGVKCAQERTAGDYRRAVETALSLDPANAELKFSAALLALWSGDKPRALDLFGQVLIFATSLTDAQKELILWQIEDDGDLKRVVPARFPQVNQWAALFMLKDPERFAALKGAFGQLQVRALEDALREYDSGLIPADIYYRHLVSLLAVSASAEVVQRADLELAGYFRAEGLEEPAQYYEERAELERLEIVPAWRAADTRPVSSCLAGWSRNDRLVFDNYYTTLGFFLPPGRRVKLLELHSPRSAKPLELEFVRIYVSDDNERWRELGEKVESRIVDYAGGSLVALRIRGSYFKYWKVHFGGAQRNNNFGNTLFDVLRVYG